MQRRGTSRPFARFYAGVVTIFVAVLLILTLRDLRAEGPELHLAFVLHPNVEDATRMLGHLTRTTIQLMVLTITVTAIVVPLTANLYTPRLIDLFVHDKVNRGFLLMLILSAVLTHYTLFVMRDNVSIRFTPRGLIILTAAAGFVCMIASIPYIYYVFNFLRPAEIIRRMRTEATTGLRRARTHDSVELRAHVAGLVSQLGETALRAAARDDRSLAADALDELETIASEYQALKPALPASWFEQCPGIDLGLPPAALDHLQAERTWFEFHLFKTVEGILPVAMDHTPDVVSRMSRLLRIVAEQASRSGDQPTVELATKFQNTFLRHAIRRRNARGFYDCSYEYTQLALSLLETDGGLPLAVAGHLSYYAEEAHRSGLPALREVALYDLADLHLGTAGAALELREKTLEELLDTYRRCPGARLESLLKVLSVALVNDDQPTVAAVGAALAQAPREALAEAARSVLEAEAADYREITGRVVDLNHVSAEARQALTAWVAKMLPAGEL